MADKTTMKDVAGRGHDAVDCDRSKAMEEEKLLKERLLDEKMKLIKQKNEERLRRQKEIEEDIRCASLHSTQAAEEKPAVTEHKMAGIQKDNNSSVSRMRGRARGRILAKMAKEELQAHRFENKGKQTYEDLENEVQKKEIRNSPPRGGSSSFLYDERRVDMSKVSSRSSNSWGGSQFEDVVEKVVEKHAHQRKKDQNIEVSMTGKERKQYIEWKEERKRIDRERKLRQKSGENWKREWDREKVHKEFSSTHERHDQHHTRRSGQRFGERTRRKPDWDLHDDRVPEKDIHYTDNNRENERDNWEEINDQKNNIAINNEVEDWENSSSTGVERHIESGLKEETILSANLEDSTTRKVNKKDDSNTNNETNETVDNAAVNSEMSKEHHTTDMADSKEVKETFEPRINQEQEDIDIKNLTVTIDSKGKRNIFDELTNNDINSHPDKMEGTFSDDSKESKEETLSVKEDKVIEEAKPQRIHKKHRRREEKESPQSSKPQEKQDLSNEMVENKKINNSELERNTTDVKVESDSITNSMSSSSHHEKSEESLPKLEIKKAEENNEDVPDFLKTPQKKNWADCEFDEELDLPPLEWGSLTK
ncbi:glutamic acid-rich protein-like [Actinia tenebrosa]|uniref:Glutamic acid-rich protein-like n=1 Tax=Actinia tenebrosa TaxID=6105 RepID=A0A6P8I2N2_ACTTE|nr:glutamic acid-rich protein-like [Actinia tenebrosa]XP_031562802.1 glutamic acid-rich protein-like [Actinia tenebrosa]